MLFTAVMYVSKSDGTIHIAVTASLFFARGYFPAAMYHQRAMQPESL
jgi:hypothetical protein